MFQKLITPFKNYFEKTKSYSNIRFILEMVLLAYISKIVFLIVVNIALSLLNIQLNNDLSFEQDQVKQGIFIILITVPFFAAIETVIGQWFFLWISSKFTKKIWIRVLFSGIIFASLHFDWAQSLAVFPVGLVLAWSFISKREKSLWSAIWITTAIHTLHNYLALLLVGFAGH